MSQWNYLMLEIGILDSLLKNFLKFAILLKKILDIFVFLSLTIISGFSSLADGFHEINAETKNVFEQFLRCEMWNCFF